MKEKEKAIIEAAIKLYATKGFTSTSIQEIVTESGISKGAFYLYFKSKDALLIAILEYYFDLFEKDLKAFEHENLLPREKFAKQLSALFQTMLEHKEFIIMQSREQAIPLNDEVKALMFRKYYEGQQFYQNSLRAIYGKEAEPHLWDLSLMIEGLFNSYIKRLFFDQDGYQMNELVEYILRRIDSLVEGLQQEQPITTEEKVEDFFKKSKAFFLGSHSDVKKVIGSMRQVIEGIKNNEDLIVSLEVLEGEIDKESPRPPVIQGMLSNFKNYVDLEQYCEEIAKFYHLKF